MIEGVGAGSVPRTNGSGSGWPKNIRSQIRIWIRNTARNGHGSNFTVERVGSETVRMDLDRYKYFRVRFLIQIKLPLWRKKILEQKMLEHACIAI
jgi:hypothetical protein